VDADALHPAENVAKMSAKIPLTDTDRQPWLERVRREVIDATPEGGMTVLGCSALKRKYRQVLMEGAPGVRLIHLHGSRELIAERLAARKGHFMPPELLDSQLAALEVPGEEEGLVVSIEGSVEEVAERCLRSTGGSTGAGQKDPKLSVH